jgi:hypothetical protein
MTSFVIGLTTAWQLVLLMLVVVPLLPSSAAYHTPMDKLSSKSEDAMISKASIIGEQRWCRYESCSHSLARRVCHMPTWRRWWRWCRYELCSRSSVKNVCHRPTRRWWPRGSAITTALARFLSWAAPVVAEGCGVCVPVPTGQAVPT